MASNSNKGVSEIVEIKDDIIDLDDIDKTPEEVIYDWDASVRKKLSQCAVADNGNILTDLMREYLQSLEDIIRSYEDNETLKNKVFCHISFLYSYFVELQCCTADNYLTIMEDILTLYCNLTLEVIRPLKKKDYSDHKFKKRVLSVTRKLIRVLTVYLLERHDHILHVLIKMNTNKISDSCSEVLKILYRHFLTKVPEFDICDEAFCRSYIVFQKWKDIQNIEDWEEMDKCVYKMFKRTPESIKTSDTLRRILMPSRSSTVDVVLSLFRSHHAISSAYFKHMLAKRTIEMDGLVFNIDLGEDESSEPVNNDDDEEVQFMNAFYEVERNMSNSCAINNIPEIDMFIKCKEEMDDDVQFVDIIMQPAPPLLNLVNDDKEDDMINNISNHRHTETDRIPMPPFPLVWNSTADKNLEVEDLKGITGTPVATPATVVETPFTRTPVPTPTTVVETPFARTPVPTPTTVVETPFARTPVPTLTTVVETASSSSSLKTQTMAKSPTAVTSNEDPGTSSEIPPEIEQVQVPFIANNSTAIPSQTAIEVKCDANITKRIVEKKSVETQAGDIRTCVYNDYGGTTPPFEPQGYEQPARTLDPHPFTNPSRNDNQNLPQHKEKRTVSTRTVEVQVDSNSRSSSPVESSTYKANGRILGALPGILKTDENAQNKSHRVIFNENTHSEKHKAPSEGILAEKQIRKDSDSLIDQGICPYNPYGLTPPSDAPPEDNMTGLQEPLRPSLSHKSPISVKVNESFYDPQLGVHSNETPLRDDVAQESTENCTSSVLMSSLNKASDKDSEVIQPEFEGRLDLAQMTNVDVDEDTEEIDVEFCQEADSNPPVHEESDEQIVSASREIALSKDLNELKKIDQIDTGQRAIQNSAPDLAPVTADSELHEEAYNGNILLKPLSPVNRTNGQSKDSTAAKIMFTSSQKLRPTLDDFSRFENAIQTQWNRTKESDDFDDILSGPVSKAVPVKANNLFTPQEKMDLFSHETNSVTVNSNSRSNSPDESPAYEGMEDFRKFYDNKLNGRISGPLDTTKMLSGILKKDKRTRRKGARITFHESVCYEKRKPHVDGILVPRRIGKDAKLNMEATVLLERLSFIEEKLKYEKCFVKYDKSNKLLSEKDERRYIPDPKLTWIIKSAPTRHNAGSLTVNSGELREKKPKKRKFEVETNSLSEPVVRKRDFRTAQKETLAPRRRGRKPKNSISSENTVASKSVSDLRELLSSGAYSDKPFRPDFPA